MNNDTTNTLRAWFGQFPKPMSQRDFAVLVGVSEGTVRRLIKNRNVLRLPDREVLLRIAEVTKGAVTPNDLAGWDAAKGRRRDG